MPKKWLEATFYFYQRYNQSYRIPKLPCIAFLFTELTFTGIYRTAHNFLLSITWGVRSGREEDRKINIPVTVFQVYWLCRSALWDANPLCHRAWNHFKKKKQCPLGLWKHPPWLLKQRNKGLWWHNILHFFHYLNPTSLKFGRRTKKAIYSKS